ncbi:sigma-70 family RNA polymerase sigma factor [Nitrospirillum iridis]|uniref:RNA polymerase sigma factor n=1 Tax=Nitrospirillum iridis TaxID=765888 RepID=A0A7X0AXH0_9PROT|nr:sigma-70 family RNA polymerase sigma factor [Nitrospirillum iridis]MBB6251858.1 RNA polymerase sigma-70 factor (ECF subfamily) [Nitrospirillum iridis]
MHETNDLRTAFPTRRRARLAGGRAAAARPLPWAPAQRDSRVTPGGDSPAGSDKVTPPAPPPPAEDASGGHAAVGAVGGDVFSHHLRAIAIQGDRAAFAAIFRHYAPRIKSYLMTTGLPAMEAEELAQEAMLAVWRKAPSFDPARAGASTWIFTIARNLRIDALRRDRVADVATAHEVLALPEPDAADDVLSATEAATRLRASLETLPPDQLAVVRLSFFEDAPHPDIAQRLGIPLGTVKSRLRLAMARLRGLIDDV